MTFLLIQLSFNNMFSLMKCSLFNISSMVWGLSVFSDHLIGWKLQLTVSFASVKRCPEFTCNALSNRIIVLTVSGISCELKIM